VNTVRYVVSGRVQGVGFRWFVMREATRLDLAGYVRNLPDGSVEVVAQGSPAGLASLESALRHGPPAARVQSVDKSDFAQQIDLAKPFEAS
jgi:acylphosphatase